MVLPPRAPLALWASFLTSTLLLPSRRSSSSSSIALALPAVPDEHATTTRQAHLPALPRLVVYFQTTHDASTGAPISMLPLVSARGIALTHLIVCSLHLNAGAGITLNDYPPDHAHFGTLWNETAVLQRAGVTVMAMVGGAAPGSFGAATLDAADAATFERYYGELRAVIARYGLQGLDIDVEQPMSQAGIARLVRRLYADFGDAFVVTLAPVASALRGGGNLSGFDYETLDAEAVAADGAGDIIDFYNAQFYSGFGSMDTPDDYEAVVAAGWDPTEVVAGQLTSPVNGYGYTDAAALNRTMRALMDEYDGEVGGIMGWEYFNGEPGGEAEPWLWAREMTEILRPGLVPALTVTEQDAERLEAAWHQSVKPADDAGDGEGEGQALRTATKVDYFAMVNA